MHDVAKPQRSRISMKPTTKAVWKVVFGAHCDLPRYRGDQRPPNVDDDFSREKDGASSYNRDERDGEAG